MEPKETLNSQSNGEKENQSWRHHSSRLQAALQSCNHQDSMVLAQKQTYRSLEQNRKLRSLHLIDPQMYGQLIFDKAGKNIK